MKIKVYLTIILLSISSCKFSREQNNRYKERIKSNTEIICSKQISKLEQLMLLPIDTLLTYCDLSNDSIKEFPDLSKYKIKILDLSYNNLDTLISEYLPQDLISINISHNQLRGVLHFEIKEQKQLSFNEMEQRYNKSTVREINLSFNYIQSLAIGFPLRKIIVSHNNLSYLNFDQKNTNYLDISYNPKLSNVLYNDPTTIDTIYRKGIANDKELIFIGSRKLGIY